MPAILSYEEIQQRMLSYYPTYCRVKLKRKKQSGTSWEPGEMEVGYALNEMCDSFQHPVEDLMLHVATLVLAAGRESEVSHRYLLDTVQGLLAREGLEALLGPLSEEDRLEVREDLMLLDIIRA